MKLKIIDLSPFAMRRKRKYVRLLKTMKCIQQTFVGLQDVLKTSSRHVLKTSSTRLQRNNFSFSKTSWKMKNCYSEDVFKTSWKHVLTTFWWTSWRHVLKTSGRHVLKTSWRQVSKTSWRRLGDKQDVYWWCLCLTVAY